MLHYYVFITMGFLLWMMGVVINDRVRIIFECIYLEVKVIFHV
jgi:hypothetical protein